MLIAVASARSSPGATTFAVAFARALAAIGRPPVLIEADPHGGVLALRFGLAERPSLATLSSDTRRAASVDDVTRNAQPVADIPCVAGPVDPTVAFRSVQTVAPVIASLAGEGGDWVCDLGRISEASPALPIAAAADLTLLLSTTSPAEVQSLLFAGRTLRTHRAKLGLVTVGEDPHTPAEVAGIASLPLIAALPDAPDIAAAFGGGRFGARQLERSVLWRSVLGTARDVAAGHPLGGSMSAQSSEVGEGEAAAAQPPPPVLVAPANVEPEAAAQGMSVPEVVEPDARGREAAESDVAQSDVLESEASGSSVVEFFDESTDPPPPPPPPPPEAPPPPPSDPGAEAAIEPAPVASDGAAESGGITFWFDEEAEV